MYECPNCAGNLKFDIARQKLYCEYCGVEADPYSFYKERDAVEAGSPSGEYEASVFVCPQCGAGLISEDTTAATFCSFCGASCLPGRKKNSAIQSRKRSTAIKPEFMLRSPEKAAGEAAAGEAVGEAAVEAEEAEAVEEEAGTASENIASKCG